MPGAHFRHQLKGAPLLLSHRDALTAATVCEPSGVQYRQGRALVDSMGLRGFMVWAGSATREGCLICLGREMVWLVNPVAF